MALKVASGVYFIHPMQVSSSSRNCLLPAPQIPTVRVHNNHAPNGRITRGIAGQTYSVKHHNKDKVMDFNQQTGGNNSNNRHNRKKKKNITCVVHQSNTNMSNGRGGKKRGPDVKRGNDPAEMGRLLGPFSIPPGSDATRSDGRRFRDSAN